MHDDLSPVSAHVRRQRVGHVAVGVHELNVGLRLRYKLVGGVRADDERRRHSSVIDWNLTELALRVVVVGERGRDASVLVVVAVGRLLLLLLLLLLYWHVVAARCASIIVQYMS